MVHPIEGNILRRQTKMSKKNQETIVYYSDCIDQLTALYSNRCDKIKELEDYVHQLQKICDQNEVNYPPLEKEIVF
jgi:hypothetical protein